jgi:hypothetical protein
MGLYVAFTVFFTVCIGGILYTGYKIASEGCNYKKEKK